MNISHENKPLSWGNNICWPIHLKRKHWCFHFLYHLVFHIFRPVWNAPLNSIAGKRYSSNFASLASLRSSSTVFNKQDFTSVSPAVWGLFCLAILSATSCEASLLGGNFWQDKKVSGLSNSLHSVGRILNFLWGDWYALSRNQWFPTFLMRSSLCSFWNLSFLPYDTTLLFIPPLLHE